MAGRLSAARSTPPVFPACRSAAISVRLRGVWRRGVSGGGHAEGVFAVYSAQGDRSALPVTVMQFTVKNTSAAPPRSRWAAGWKTAFAATGGDVCSASASTVCARRALGSSRARRRARAAEKRARAGGAGRFRGRRLRQVDRRRRRVRHGPGQGNAPWPAASQRFQGRAWSTRSFAATNPRTFTSTKFEIERAFINFLIGGGNIRARRAST